MRAYFCSWQNMDAYKREHCRGGCSCLSVRSGASANLFIFILSFRSFWRSTSFYGCWRTCRIRRWANSFISMASATTFPFTQKMNIGGCWRPFFCMRISATCCSIRSPSCCSAPLWNGWQEKCFDFKWVIHHSYRTIQEGGTSFGESPKFHLSAPQLWNGKIGLTGASKVEIANDSTRSVSIRSNEHNGAQKNYG